MPLTLARFKRLPIADREELIRKNATMLAYESYLRAHSGCDPEQAVLEANRTWRDFREMALDLLAVSMAQTEQLIEAN